MRTITTPDELDALAQAHDHGGQVVILHCRRPDDPYGREWRLYHLEWERWDEPDGTVTHRPVWYTDDRTGAHFDEDWLHETTPAYVVEPQEPVGEDMIERAARVMHAEVCCPCDPQGCDAPHEEMSTARALADAGRLATPPVVTDEMVADARREYDRSEDMHLALTAALGVDR